MEENTISEQESLNLIEQMIGAARNDHRDRGDGWLIWGWLLFGASVASIILMLLNLPRYVGPVWTGMLVAGSLFYFLFSARKKRRRVVRTYVEELLDKFGTGFFISLFTMVAAGFITRSNAAFGYYYILYAFWMFIQGSALRFRPLIVGAAVNWMAAILIFLSTGFLYTMIISATAILVGYLIPGFLLRRLYHQKTKSTFAS
jgi:hypothetical protein